MDKRILIGTPIRDRAWIIPYYLSCLYGLNYDKKLIDLYWIINNSSDQSQKLLKDFKYKYNNEYNSITIEITNKPKLPTYDRENSVGIRQEVYPWLAYLRNKLLDKCVSFNCDYLWSTDSDILFKPDTLSRLLSHNIPVVSALLYNGYLHDGIESAYKYPNILREIKPRLYQHISNYRIKNPQLNSFGTLIEVDYTGASILISKDVCKVAKYDGNKIYGEDESFCWSAKQNGYKLYCDISLFLNHIMSPELLKVLGGEFI